MPKGGTAPHPWSTAIFVMSTAKKPCKPAYKKVRKNDGVALTDDQVRVVKIQFQKDTSFDRFDDLLKEYCRFLEIKVANPDKLLAPSYLIDKLWHAHILSTREYVAFCDRYNNGAYLHHDPTMKSGQDRYALTMTEYENMYGGRPEDLEIWPENVETNPVDSTRVQVNQRQEAEETKQGDSDSLKSEEQSESDSETEYSIVKNCQYREQKKALREYLDAYGDQRGTSESELSEWHKEYIKLPENHEGFDPNECCQCYVGHYWIKGEFDIGCGACRETSEELGSYVCG
jgi:hypothetical protein